MKQNLLILFLKFKILFSRESKESKPTKSNFTNSWNLTFYSTYGNPLTMVNWLFVEKQIYTKVFFSSVKYFDVLSFLRRTTLTPRNFYCEQIMKVETFEKFFWSKYKFETLKKPNFDKCEIRHVNLTSNTFVVSQSIETIFGRNDVLRNACTKNKKGGIMFFGLVQTIHDWA